MVIPEMKAMKWYVAELIVACRVGRSSPELWDKQIVLLRARSADLAYAVALETGKSRNHAYRNSVGNRVSWTFKGLANLEELLGNVIRSGTEVHSQLIRGKKPPKFCSKRKLTVFWAERNKHKTASELLDKNVSLFAPR
jgi:hypothetical protein